MVAMKAIGPNPHDFRLFSCAIFHSNDKFMMGEKNIFHND